MTSRQEDADLQAALAASARHESAASGSTPATPSTVAPPVAAAAPQIAFAPVTDMLAFKTQINAALKRLQDGSNDSRVELNSFAQLLAATREGVLGDEATRFILRDVLLPGLNHVLARTYLPDQAELHQRVQGIVQAILDLVAQHHKNNLPQPLQPLPPLTSLPISLLKPPAPPALTLPPIVPGAAGAAQSGATGGTAGSASSPATMTVNGVAIPVAFPPAASASSPSPVVYGPALPDESGMPRVTTPGVSPSPSPVPSIPDEEKSAPVVPLDSAPNATASATAAASEEPELPPPPQMTESRAAVPAAAAAPAVVSPSPATDAPMSVVVDRAEGAVEDEAAAAPSFLDIARGGLPASPFPVPPRSLSPGVSSPAAPAGVPSPGPGATSSAGASAGPPAAAAATQFNRDLDLVMMELLDAAFDDSKRFYTQHGLDAPPPPLPSPAASGEGVVEAAPAAEADPTLDPDSGVMVAFRAGLKVGDWVDVLHETGSGSFAKRTWRCATIVAERNPAPQVAEAAPEPVNPEGAVPVPAAADKAADADADVDAEVAAAASASPATSEELPAAAPPAVIIPPAPPAEWRLFYEGQTDRAMEWMRKSEAVWKLAPLYSRTGKALERWRRDLGVGDAVDACDHLRKWYTARVGDVRGAMVLVCYDGWGPAFDEWMARSNERLALHRTRALGGKETGGVSAPYADRKYNDASDPEDSVALWRGKDNGGGSRFLAANVAHFQACHGGLELLLQRMVHKHGPGGASPPMGVPALRKMVSAVSRVVPTLSRSFALRYIPLFRLALTETLLSLSDIELRGLSKEALEEMMKNMQEKVLTRIYAPRDASAFLECFALECAYKRFISPIVERRINGMSYLQEYASLIRRPHTATWLSAQGFVEWVQNKRILAESFGAQGHPELMRKSAELLRFIASEQRLETTHLDLLWRALEAAMRRCDEARLAIIYKVLDDIAWNLQVAHLTYLFHKVRTEIPLREYTIGTLDLIKELTRFTHRAGPEASKHAMDLLWSISQDESGAGDEIQHAARARLEELGSSHKNFRLHFLERCVAENIATGGSVPQTLALMQKLIDSFPETVATYHYAGASPSAEEQTRHHVIMYLDEQFGLMKHFFDDMARFKNRALAMAQSGLAAETTDAAAAAEPEGPRSVPHVNSMVVSSKTSYLKQIQDRLNFLQYLLVNSNTGVAAAPAVATATPTTAAMTAAATAPASASPAPGAASADASPAESESKELESKQSEGETETAPAVAADSEAADAAIPESADEPAAPAATATPAAVAAPATTVTTDSLPPVDEEESKSDAEPTAPASASASAPGGPADTHTVPASSSAPASSSPAPPAAPPVAAAQPVPGLKLEQSHLDALWDHFYTRSLSPAERESFFRWLRNACVLRVSFLPPSPSSSYSTYTPPTPPQAKSYFSSPELLDATFDRILREMRPERMELSFFLAFQHCFLALNQKEGTLELRPQPPPPNPSYSSSGAAQQSVAEAASLAAVHGDFTVRDFSGLRGFEALWTVALEAPSVAPPAETTTTTSGSGAAAKSKGGNATSNANSKPKANEVVSKSSELLNKLYSPVYLSEDLVERAGPTESGGISGMAQIRSHYIARCIENFKVGIAAKKGSSAESGHGGVGGANLSRASRCLALLHSLLDTSENLKGLGGLRSHGTQTRGRLLRLVINHPTGAGAGSGAKKAVAAATSADAASAAANSGSSNGAAPPRKEVRVYSNDTLFDLRSLLSKQLLIPLDLIKLYVVGKQLTPELNRMHLHELRIRDGQSILVSRRQEQIAKVELVDKALEGRPMTPLFRAAITEMFFKYAEKENDAAPPLEGYPLRTMSKANMATYILSCGAGEGSASDERLGTIFTKYARPVGWAFAAEELSVEGFCEFYRDACGDRVENVWSDLRCHGYRNDLRREADIMEEESKQQADPKYAGENSRVLPRYLIASNNQTFSLLFQALLDHQTDGAEAGATGAGEDSSLSSLIWSLLQRLPSNQELYMNLFSLQGVTHAKADGPAGQGAGVANGWDALLDSHNVYKLLYALQILESLTEPIKDEGAEGVFVGGSEVAAPVAPAAKEEDATPAVADGKDGGAAADSDAATIDAPSSAQHQADLLSARDAWSRKFLHSGGFQHLYSILVESHLFEEDVADAASHGNHASNANGNGSANGRPKQTLASTPLTRSLRKKCLTLLLKMLAYYLLAAMNSEAPSANAGATAAAAGGLGFVTRIRSESIDTQTESEREEESRAMEAERARVEAENRAAGGANLYTPGFTSPVLHGPAPRPFENGNGPIVNPAAPVAPALYPTVAAAAAVVEEVKSDGGPALSHTRAINGATDDDADGNDLPAPSRPDLLLLGRQMSSGFSNAVLSCVDFSQLLKVLWHIITLAADSGSDNAAPASSPSAAGAAAAASATADKEPVASPTASSSTSLVLYNPSTAAAASDSSDSAPVVTVSAAAALEQVNADMSEPALACLVNILIYDQSRATACAEADADASQCLLSQFYSLVEQNGCVDFFRVLYNPLSSQLRKYFANTLHHICRRVHPPSSARASKANKCAAAAVLPPPQYFLGLLLQHLPTPSGSAGEAFSSADCTEYFGLLSKLIQNRIAESNAAAAAAASGANGAAASALEDEFAPIVRTLLSHLRAHPSQEVASAASGGGAELTLCAPNKAASAATTPKQDNILCGLLQILADLLAKLPALRLAVGQGQAAKKTDSVDASADAQEERGLVHELFYSFLFAPPLPPVPTAADAPVLQLPPPPRCQSKASRALAFALLSTLCEGCVPNFLQLYRYLQLQQSSIQARLRAASAASLSAPGAASGSSAVISVGDYNPEKLVISPSGYVGLRNLGATCFMNSLMQQLFHVPAFRYGILQAAPAKLAALQAKGPSAELDDSLLYQLQNLFGFLSASHKQFVDTSSFCRAYKDEDGRPINPRIQQDAQEYFNVVLDRLEFALKTDAQYSGLIAGLFEGKLVNQMACQGGCGTVRESSESYMTLSLEVKGKLGLEESLRSYTEGEALSGINCDACGAKADTTKRVCLGALPHTLFFHLKRFQLSYESFQHEKLNDRFEFPLHVDMEPYTKEGLARIEAERLALSDPTITVPARYSVHPKEYYSYTLYGVLVHTGQASSGHYYSFIKERAGAGAGGGDGQGGQWFEFNDTTIRPFDIARDLDEQCFGGETSVSENSWGIESVSTSERVKNAYMLVYEREGQYRNAAAAAAQPLKDSAAPSAPTATTTAVASPSSICNMPGNLLSLPLSSVLPPRLQSRVLQDNAYFLEDRFIYSGDYFDFMKEVVRQGGQRIARGELLAANGGDAAGAGVDFALQFTHLATTFLLDTLLRSADARVVTEYLSVLEGLYAAHAPSCVWLLDYLSCGGDMGESMRPLSERKLPSPQLLVDMLLAQREVYVRKSLLSLIMACLMKLLPEERAAGLWDPARGFGPEHAARGSLQRYFLLHHSLLAEAAPKNWVRFHEYLQFYLLFAQLTGVDGRRFMIAHGVITALADLYLQDSSPIALADKAAGRKSKRVSMGNMVTQPSFGPLLHVLSLLARTCFLPTTMRPTPDGPRLAEEVHLPIPPTMLQDAYIILPDHDQQQQEPAVATVEEEVAVEGVADGSSVEKQADGAAVASAEATATAAAEPSAAAASVSDSVDSSSSDDSSLPLLTAQSFTEQDYKMLTCPALYASAFGSSSSDAVVDHLIPLACHMSYEHSFLSTELIQIVINGVHKSDATTVKPFFELMAALVAIQDSVQPARYDKLLAPNSGVLHSLYVYRDHSARFTYVSIKFLCRIMTETPAFARRMMECRQAAWLWIDRWLSEYAHKKPVSTAAISSSGSGSGPPPSAGKVQEMRLATLAQYRGIVELYGGALNLDPPPLLMIGDSKGNASAANVSGASGSGSGSAPADAGHETIKDRNPNGVDSATPAGEFVAVGVKVDPEYLAAAAVRAGGGSGSVAGVKRSGASSDDEFDETVGAGAGPGGVPHPSAKSARARAALKIALSNQPGSGMEPLDLTRDDSDEVVPPSSGGRGAGLVDAEDDDATSSSYKQRNTASPTNASDEIACAICTYLNASYRHTCEMCGTALKVTTADMD